MTYVTHHALPNLPRPFDGGTLRGVSVTEAVPPDHHIVDGVVILLFNLYTRIQEVVPERVQFGELDPQVGDLQHV